MAVIALLKMPSALELLRLQPFAVNLSLANYCMSLLKMPSASELLELQAGAVKLF